MGVRVCVCGGMMKAFRSQIQEHYCHSMHVEIFQMKMHFMNLIACIQTHEHPRNCTEEPATKDHVTALF